MDKLQLRFGLYAQVWEPSTQTNSMHMRQRGPIALGPLTTSTTSYMFLELDTGKIINCAQFTEIPMTESMINCVNQLGLSEPAMLTWTICHGENVGNGPLWDAMPTSRDASNPSNVEESTEEDDKDVSVAEEDWENPTTEINVVNNITGVDDTHDVYKEWNKVVPEVGDVSYQIDDDVQVVTKLTSLPPGHHCQFDCQHLLLPEQPCSILCTRHVHHPLL